MSSPIVRVKNISKRYRIGAAAPAYMTFREAITQVVTAPFRNFTRLRRLTEFKNTDEPDVVWALKDVSFDVQEGEVLGIIGRNGAGKTTILKILSRITEPSAGTVEIHGRVSSLLEVGTGFHPELTGRENVFLNGAILGMRKREIERKFDDIVSFAEIERFIDTPVKHFSSGMYVRLAFAVAAHLEPDILLVDEVLAVGDAQFQKKCLGKMGDIAKGGRTVIFVSHNMAAVQQLCPRAILLKNGRLDTDGPTQQVIRQYIGGDESELASRVWENKEQAPGNALARLRSVSILGSDGETAAEISTDKDFFVEVKYYVMRENLRPGVTVVVYNQEGTCVFSSLNNHEKMWYGKPHPIGFYRSTCHVPRSLLADGEYSVTVLLWERNFNLICREDRVVRFHLVESGNVRVDFLGRMDGVIRPLLEWHTDQVSNS
jgi:lipopolysaccharide transport system ATP-binding protein